MMKNKAYNLSNYSFHRGESLLLDANVWLYLYPPPSGSFRWHAAKYTQGLKRMLSAGALLIIDALVLSEYVNTYCRIEWNARYRTIPFKKFRRSPNFAVVGRGAADYARKILAMSKRCDHPFTHTDVTQVLTGFETGANDLNDGLLAETCRRNRWKLVTNDADFTTGGIKVLTTHPTLLRKCP